MVRTLIGTTALALAASAGAQPVDLNDPRPRLVQVAFEVSPPDRPGQLDAIYTARLPAWLAPDEGPGRVSITLSRGYVERDLMAGFDPLPGSFDDFRWVFDAATGHVLSARTGGTVRRRVTWGPFESRAEPSIRVSVDTLGPAGFEPPKRLFGHLVFAFCAGSQPGCHPVSAKRYDADTGYVNAVGRLRVRWGGLSWETFAPLGEALFSEAPRASDPTTRTASERVP